METAKLEPAAPSTKETAYEDFHRQGYVLLPNVLDAAKVAQLRTVIDQQAGSGKQSKKKHTMFKRVFERHPDLCLDVFKNKPVLSIVRKLLGCCGSPRGKGDSGLEAHVIHNNAFRIDPGMKGQAVGWHTDDPPVFQTTDGRPLPVVVKISPLVLTCMFFLNDLDKPEDGGTRIIEGSHRFGCLCTDEVAAKHPQLYTRCSAGSVLIFSAHTWHRGAPVLPGSKPRYVFQATYGRRLIGHKHDTVMNYNLPKNVERALDTEEDRKLM
ncbi:Phytanoyl-CoA dioxygenase (PhyH) [Seminavis robusta]|uniref:Phytanoyl-CoA dioxygenase (PhyH) n=1 Tax=Seminavis robusta TaxID=568900 RepID=A0A9N8HUA3_9STRA|nr:Phytanoyl-CoA dioxygenase (PhyH) [Seminavis robusta]|eukprot:Sro2022_g311510.1 Phytanoyl-CoA dioxygenase (PhyH) (267) ;mRNA; r:10224-11024